MVILTEAPCDGTVRRMEVIREEQRRFSLGHQRKHPELITFTCPLAASHPVLVSGRHRAWEPALDTVLRQREQFGLCSELRGTVCPADC